MDVTCPNCGSETAGPYCGSCGQSQQNLDQSTWQLLKESAEDLFHLEGRAFRTVRPLLLHPGVVTREYLRGRRAHYTPPFRLYLVASAAFFLGFLLTRSIDQAYYGLAPGDSGAYANTMARVLILLLPVFAVVLKILYLRSRRPLVHHLVFALHTGAAGLLGFLALTLAAAGLKAWWGEYAASPGWLPDFVWWLYLPGLLVFLGYVALALRRTYGSSWLGAGAQVVIISAVAVALFFWLVPRLLIVL